MEPETALLWPDPHHKDTVEFESQLRAKIVGQDAAIEALVELYQMFCASLNAPNRPVGTLLFLGPTGTGKTRLAEAAAEILVGDSHAVIKVNCAHYQHLHDISKVIGSSPGWLGHKEKHPLITEDALRNFHTDELKLSFLLFDHVEKTSDALWQLLQEILDKGTLTLGDNRRVDLSRTFVFLTSNLRARGITELISDASGSIRSMEEPHEKLDQRVESTTVEVARRTFSPEFRNRLDKVVVFRPLHPDQLLEILDIELAYLQRRVLQTGKGEFVFRVTCPAKRFLVQEGLDKRHGAHQLKRALERHLVHPLANLLATEQIRTADRLCIDWDARVGRLVFWKEGVMPQLLVPWHSAVSMQHGDCRGWPHVEFPTLA